jgi:hypothetical protein
MKRLLALAAVVAAVGLTIAVVTGGASTHHPRAAIHVSTQSAIRPATCSLSTIRSCAG